MKKVRNLRTLEKGKTDGVGLVIRFHRPYPLGTES